MQADPNRQWFVYYNEKEMGPFPEKDILQKLSTSELDATAYMFTDGLSDWELVTDLPIFKQAISTTETPLDAADITSAALEDSLASSLSPSEGASESLGVNGEDLMDPANIPDPTPPRTEHKPDDTKPLKSEIQSSAPPDTKLEGLWSSTPEEPASSLDKIEITQVTAVHNVNTGVEKVGAPQTVSTSQNAKASTTKNKEPSATVAPPAPNTPLKPKPKRWFLYVGLVAATLLTALVLKPDLLPGSKSLVPAENQTATNTEAPPTTATAENNSTVPSPAADREIDWAELQALRQNPNPQAPPFRLASNHYGDLRPIIVGVLSPLVSSTRLQIAIYPSNEKTLMAIPRIWFLDVPVVSGYFSAGPLTDSGEKLSPGKYIVAVTANGTWLGDVSFELGQWPDSQQLAALEENLKTTRKTLAEKEKISLEEKMTQISAAANQLQVLGKQFTQGAAAKDWSSKSKDWFKPFNTAMEDQRLVLSGPMFFPESQQKLFTLMQQLEKIRAAMDLQVISGAKSVTQKYGKGLGSLWVDYNSYQSVVRGEIQLLNPEGVLVLKIDPELVKKRLVEFGR